MRANWIKIGLISTEGNNSLISIFFHLALIEGATAGEGASKSLTFGQSATTSCNIFSGYVFMVTNLRRDKFIEDVMNKDGVDETPPTDEENAENTLPTAAVAGMF